MRGGPPGLNVFSKYSSGLGGGIGGGIGGGMGSGSGIGGSPYQMNYDENR